MTQRIEDYGLIGDCRSAALVGRDGAIDWLCWPRFDSDAVFARLVGTDDNGFFRIAPKAEATKVARAYRKDTLILETRFETADGAVKLIDFMPGGRADTHCIRIVEGERGRVRMRMDLVIRFGYGAVVPWVTRSRSKTLRAVAGPDMLVLTTPVETRGENLSTVAEFEVAAGERVPFTLSCARSHLEPDPPPEPESALRATETFWRDWVAEGRGDGKYRDLVTRSLITLKALSFAPTGGIVAAPTTSLPEKLGSQRNWDYRFCWLRDSTMTLLALMNEGHFGEAKAWRDWLIRAVAGRPEQMQIMYGIAGERRLTEWEAPWLAGYRQSKPVRIGNAAHAQLQLDVYGEVMDTLHQGRRGGLPGHDAGWDVQRLLLINLEQVWREPDSGLWEVRDKPRHFTYSKAMCWVAFDRGVRSAEKFNLDGPVERWRALCKEIWDDVMSRGVSRKLGNFVRCYGSEELDASLLLLAPIGFIEANDEHYRATVAAIEKRLKADGLVFRYDSRVAPDGLPAGEGAFLACSFWLADAYLLTGRRKEAEALFEHLTSYCNDVGLLSEEIDPRTGSFLGNFPQAFSHVAMLGTAANLGRADKPAEQRSDRRAEPAPAK